MFSFISLLASIPDLIKIYKAVQKRIDQSDQDRKIKDDLKKIGEAFDEKDATKLDHIFNQLPSETTKA